MMPSTHPQQTRSRQTRTRLLDAAEEVLGHVTFDAMTVHEVAARAGMTTGAIYQHFGSKSGLVGALVDRLHEEWGRGLAVDLSPARLAEATLRPQLLAVVHRILRGYRARGGLVRAITIGTRTDPLLRDRDRQFDSTHFFGPLQQALSSREDVRHPHPDAAIPFALFMIANALGAFALFPEMDPSTLRISDADFAEHLVDAVLAYLQVDETRLGS